MNPQARTKVVIGARFDALLGLTCLPGCTDQAAYFLIRMNVLCDGITSSMSVASQLTCNSASERDTNNLLAPSDTLGLCSSTYVWA